METTQPAQQEKPCNFAPEATVLPGSPIFLLDCGGYRGAEQPTQLPASAHMHSGLNFNRNLGS
jgi:hypothetical protein